MGPNSPGDIEWKGESWYRLLSYYCHLQWNSEALGRYAQRVLEAFRVSRDHREERTPPTPGLPPTYSLLDLGPDQNHGLRYRLLYQEDLLAASQGPDYVLSHLFWHTNMEAGRQTGSFLIVHSGAVRSPAGHGILLPGASGSGKSTLVAALVRAGFDYLSDEFAAIDPVTRHVYPYWRAITLKQPMLFEKYPDLNFISPVLTLGEWHLIAGEIRPGALAEPSPPCLIIVPAYRKGSHTELVRLGRARGALVLGENVVNVHLYGARALRLIGEIAGSAEFFSLISGDLEEAVEAIRQVAATPGSDQVEKTLTSLEAKSPW